MKMRILLVVPGIAQMLLQTRFIQSR